MKSAPPGVKGRTAETQAFMRLCDPVGRAPEPCRGGGGVLRCPPPRPGFRAVPRSAAHGMSGLSFPAAARGAALLLAFALAVGLGSCAPEPVADRRATAEEWRAVEAAKRALDAARGSDGAREEVERLADELSRRLVAF